MAEPEGIHTSFPQDPVEFDADHRISFSQVSNKFLLETDDGQEFEFDDKLKRWIPVVRPHPFSTEGLRYDVMLPYMYSIYIPSRLACPGGTLLKLAKHG